MKGNINDLLKALKPLGNFKRIGNQLKFNCPRCENELGMPPNKYNLEINFLRNAFHCWSCNQHGNLYGIIKKYGYKEFLDLFRIENLNEIDFKKEERKEVEMPRYVKSALSIKEVTNYLFSRNITKEIINKRDIKYCYNGIYNNWIIFPSYNIKNELTSILYHDFKNKQYRNKRSSDYIVFYENFIDKNSLIIITEGVYDALVVPNAIPLLGNEVNKKMLDFLSGTRVLLILDADMNEKIVIKRIKELKSTCKEVLIHKLTGGIKDLNEFSISSNELLREQLKVYYSRAK
jgi:hypothetical protein